MGYFSNAFLFGAEPQFRAVAEAFPTCSLRGYKHAAQPLWLLDLWEKPWRGGHSPFATPAGPKHLAVPACTPATAAFLRQLDQLLAALKGEIYVYGARECRLALAVAADAAVPTFFFVADDELFDLAAWAGPGVLRRLRFWLDWLVIDYGDGAARVTPVFFPEDDEEEPPEGLVEAVRGAVDWSIAEPRAVEGGLRLYESVLALWPPAFGDPSGTLGIGTWDPFDNLDRDFAVVFESHAS